MSNALSFEQTRDGALAYCQADDIEQKLQAVELDASTINTVLQVERQKRVARFTSAVLSAAEQHRITLTDQLATVEEILGNHVPEQPASESRPDLPDDLLGRLSTGEIDKDTFVNTAKLYGNSHNIAARTFYRIGGNRRSHKTIELDPLVEELMQDNKPDGTHPMLSMSYFGPKMLDALFDVADGYLSALDHCGSEQQA